MRGRVKGERSARCREWRPYGASIRRNSPRSGPHSRGWLGIIHIGNGEHRKAISGIVTLMSARMPRTVPLLPAFFEFFLQTGHSFLWGFLGLRKARTLHPHLFRHGSPNAAI